MTELDFKVPPHFASLAPGVVNATKIDPCFVDLYEGDVNGNPNLYTLADAGYPWCGVSLKVSQGLHYSSATRGWLKRLWPTAKAAAGSRYGRTWFRGGYHYLTVGEDGRKQADFYLSIVDSCGGCSDGDLWPSVDIEEADQPAHATNQQIIDCASAFAERVTAVTGRMVLRYSGSYIRDRKIVDAMGCKLLWVADWDPNLSPATYIDQGYTLTAKPGSLGLCILWQGVGDGKGGWNVHGYPLTAPVGKAGAQVGVDISAGIVNGGADPDAVLAWIAAHLGSQAA